MHEVHMDEDKVEATIIGIVDEVMDEEQQVVVNMLHRKLGIINLHD